jgi:hypothetical protein
MENLKRPDFDRFYSRTTVEYYFKGIPIGSPIDGAVKVTVKYRGVGVDLSVRRRVSDCEFVGVVIGFLPAQDRCGDLSLGDAVVFSFDQIWGIWRDEGPSGGRSSFAENRRP